MKRYTMAAAAASILLLAAGTGTADFRNPFGESFAAGMAFIGAVDNVDVEVIRITLVDWDERRVTITWTLHNEDSSIANYKNGYCVAVSVAGGSWAEECRSGVPSSRTTYPRVTTLYYAHRTLDVPYGVSRVVKARVKMRYGARGGHYTSWSPEYDRRLLFRP